MKTFFAVCALLLFPAFCPASPDGSWREYVNERFGYSVEYPALPGAFDAPRESENGDGVWFESKDEAHTLTLSGGWNVLGDDGKAMLERRLEGVAHVSVQESGEGWYRLVYGGEGGKDGTEHVFYEYGIVDEEAWASFVLEWPKDEDERFLPVAARMEKSLSLPQKKPGA